MWQYGRKRQTNARHEGFKGREVEMLRGLRSCCRDVERFEVERSHTRRLSRSSDGSQNRLSCLESPGSCNHEVSPLQGLLSCAFVCLGAHVTKLWSVAPPGLNGDDELIRGVSLRSTPSLYYFAHKGLIHRHQSVHSVNSLENRSCSYPSSRKSAFHLNLRHLRAIHSNPSVFSASLCGKNTNPVHPFNPVICVPIRLCVASYALQLSPPSGCRYVRRFQISQVMLRIPCCLE